MKVTMVRKVNSKAEWYDAIERMRTLFGREPQQVDAVIEKEITLTATELAAFERDMLADSEIIEQNIPLMRVDENEIWHCISITSKTAKYRILVESEGTRYARYSAIVPKQA